MIWQYYNNTDSRGDYQNPDLAYEWNQYLHVEYIAAELSLSLGGLQAEFVTAIGVIELNLSALGKGKSLGCSLVSLYFCHFRVLLFEYSARYAPDVRVGEPIAAKSRQSNNYLAGCCLAGLMIMLMNS